MLRLRPAPLIIAAIFVAGVSGYPRFETHPAAASTVMAMELDALVAAADRIVIGEVLSVASAWNSDRTNIFTTIEVQVAEAWKGRGGRVTVTQPGGSVGDIEQRVHGLPVFTPGERSVMFLSGTPARVVGWGQGRRFLRQAPGEQTWMVDGGDRKATVRRGPDGALRQAEGQGAQPLADLRRQVLSLMKNP